jgi:predicted small metal-binding protein
MTENIEEKEIIDVREPVIGEFKPKRKFLSFVSAISGKKIRLIRETAFIEGRKLSGMLERAKFKITICDEGTINFEEVEGTNLADTAMKQRLINEIDSTDVSGYAQKFIVTGLEFEDQDGHKCFLEVEHVKPYDKLMNLFEEEKQKEETTELSEKGLSFLDMLLSGEDNDKVANVLFTSENDEELARELEGESDEEIFEKPIALTYMEEQFNKMNEDKINELKERIEKTETEIKRYNSEAKHAEANAEKSSEALSILETRLETLVPNAASNGYVFLVSDEQKSEIGLNDSDTELVGRISELMKLKKDVLIKHLTESFYKISIAKKNNFEDKETTKEIYKLVQSVDLFGKFTVTAEGEFEYRGKLNWHQLTAKMLKKGFEQEPEFDKVAGSNSYEVKTGAEGSDSEFVLIEEKTSPNTVHPTRELTKKVQNPEFKQKTLRTFDKPETIVVIGDGDEFQITDDESGFDLYVGGEYKHGICCFGCGSVMTLNEYKYWQQNNDLEDSTDMVDAYLIPGFVGTIGISAKLDDGSFSNEFDLDDYICHQFDGYADVVINFPEGTELYKIKNHDLSTVTAALRDDKITSVLS